MILVTARTIVSVLGGLAVAAAAASAAKAAVIKAEYLFDNTLSSSVAGAPALTATDPLGQSGFVTDTVFGDSRTVYKFDGAASPFTNEGGLTFDNSAGLLTQNSYSINMVVELTERDNAWRRLVDVSNRTSDAGFYVDSNNRLGVFPAGGGGAFTLNEYHSVALTVADDGIVKAYLDGSLVATVGTTVMNIDNPSNPGGLVNFFLDNSNAEWSPGTVASILLYDGVLTADEVTALAEDPFPQAPAPVPEPGSLAITGSALAGAAVVIRRRRAAA